MYYKDCLPNHDLNEVVGSSLTPGHRKYRICSTKICWEMPKLECQFCEWEYLLFIGCKTSFNRRD